MLCVRPTRDLFTMPPCVCKSMPGCWFMASLGGTGVEGSVGAQPAPQNGLRRTPARGEKHIKDPFYSVNVSWSNLSHVCTFLDSVKLQIELKAYSSTSFSRIVCKHKAWSSFSKNSVVAFGCSMWKMKGWLTVLNIIHSFSSSFSAEGFHDFMWCFQVVKVTFRYVFLTKYSDLIAGKQTMSFWCCSSDCLACLLYHIHRVTSVLWAWYSWFEAAGQTQVSLCVIVTRMLPYNACSQGKFQL